MNVACSASKSVEATCIGTATQVTAPDFAAMQRMGMFRHGLRVLQVGQIVVFRAVSDITPNE